MKCDDAGNVLNITPPLLNVEGLHSISLCYRFKVWILGPVSFVVNEAG